MHFQNVSIAGLAHVDGPHRISSEDLENQLSATMARIEMPAGMLRGLTGIAARRWFDPGTQPSDVATLAAEKLLAQVDVPRARIGILVNTSVCRDYLEPSTACIAHGNLGLPSTALNFDVGNACLGFLNGMTIVGNMIELGQIDYGLVVDGEDSRQVVEATIKRLNDPATTVESFRAQFATLTLGSGGAAMLLCHRDLAPDAPRYTGSVTVAATEHRRLCWGQRDRMYTDTRALLKAGVSLANDAYKAACTTFEWTADALDHLMLHQVSKVHTKSLCAQLGLDVSKAPTIFEEFGNIGPAAVPITLSKAADNGRFAKGDRIALMGIGSGLNCMMAEIQW